jgi:hypothetical protein
MGKAGSKLSAKERIGYEVFFFTAVYGLYNVFFALPLAIDTLVFIALFGSLFVRYHLVVSDEDLDESPAARMTGTAMFVVSVAISSHLAFKALKSATTGFGPGLEPYLVLLGGAASGVFLIAVFNHSVFRYDEQRRATFKEKAKGEDGPVKYIARVSLFLEQQSERGNYDFDVEGSVDFEKSRRLFLKMREGEISPDEHNQLKQQLKRQRDIIPILVVGFHALLSIFLLFAFVATAELFTPTESVEMLGFSFLVIGVYNSFMLLHTRFGLRREISRKLRTMPVELVTCVIVAFAAVSNADLIHGAAILVVMPAALYLTSGWGFSSSKKLFLILARFIGENPSEEYVELMKEVMDKEEGSS